MALTIKRAVKHDSKLRMSIAGPSGSGKTFTALTLATALAGEKGVLVLDTERGSASKYADLFTFDVIELDSFSPVTYVEAIKLAEESGHGVLVIDSLSHAWNGTGGLLEIVDSIARRKYQGNSFAAWKDATPLQNQLIDAITRSRLHIIVTMRSKQEYALEKDERTGKTQPKKIGMAPIQRDGMEYEMDIHAEMDIDNTMIVQKSRCSELSGQIIPRPGVNVAEALKTWLQGVPAPEPTRAAETPQQSQQAAVTTEEEPATQQQLTSIAKLCQALKKDTPKMPLSLQDAKTLIVELSAEYKERKAKAASQTEQTQTAAAPAQIPALVDMIAKAKRRVETLDMLWDDVKRDSLKKTVQDAALTVAQAATINITITEYEHKKSARTAKAS